MPQPIKHQLFIHLDLDPNGSLEVRYSYPLSTPPIGEHVVRKTRDQVPTQLREDLEEIRFTLSKRIVLTPIRAPHAVIFPRISLGGTTVVIQDQTRAKEIPHARLYYYEVVANLGINVEKELHMGPSDFVASGLQPTFRRIKEKIKGIAWQDYTRRVGSEYLRP